MQAKTRQKLDSYRANEPQRGSDGQMHSIDRVTRIPMEQSLALADLHSRIKPELSVEAGLAYGFSTLPILDVMDSHGYGHHIAIDPFQMENWHGVAYAAVEDLGFAGRFTLKQTMSELAFVELIQAGRKVQYAFLDGNHAFEGYISDIYLVDRLMDVGGLLVVNDMWLPAVRSVASYMRGNLLHYEEIPSVHENIFVAKKLGRDERVWNHFVPFDGKGLTAREAKAAKNPFRRLFSRA